MSQNNILPRVCKECGRTFNGGPRAWYCPECREIRKKEQNRAFKDRKKKGQVVPLGSVIKCVNCGAEFVKEGGLHQRCKRCAQIHLKEIDNMQSKEWKRKNQEKYLEAKREFSKKRHKEEGREQISPYISWDKESRKWRVVVELKHVGYRKTYDEAKGLLNKYLEGKIMKRYEDCIRSDGMCGICSLVSRGMDCHNNRISGLLYERTAMEMSQKELSERSGVNIRQIQRYESLSSDTGNMTLKNALALAKVLECNVEDLI